MWRSETRSSRFTGLYNLASEDQKYKVQLKINDFISGKMGFTFHLGKTYKFVDNATALRM